MYIGIDLGTSAVKIILVDKLGNIIRSSSNDYPLHIVNQTWTEQDPNDWYEKTLEGLHEIVLGYEEKVLAISFSGQMHGLVVLDCNDNIIRNAILWNDQRTIKEVDFLNNEFGKDRLLDLTGNIASTGLTLPKLLWMKENELENYKKIDKVMLPKDYLIYKLTSIFASDVSDTSGTLYYDVENKRYSEEIISLLDLKLTNFPKIFESYDVVGTLSEDIKLDLNLTNNVKVIAGGGDQAVGAVGVGAVNDNDVNISLGTSGVVFVSANKFVKDNISFLQSYAHANGKYHLMSVMLSAAGSIKWFNEKVLDNEDYIKLYEEIEKISPNDSIFFLPYLSGERASINDPYARGVFFGLNLSHTKYNMARAVVEGVSFALKESLDSIKKLGIDIKHVKITGGGSKSDFWCQLLSNILDVKIDVIQVNNGPALGAAILAMVGNKEYKNVIEACKNVVKTKMSYLPDSDLVKIFAEKYEIYKNIYPSLKKLFRK